MYNASAYSGSFSFSALGILGGVLGLRWLLRTGRPAILVTTLLLCHGLARGLGAALPAGGRGAGAALPLAGAGLAGPPLGIALPFPPAGLGAGLGRPIGLGLRAP
jgi:hypothetical protein